MKPLLAPILFVSSMLLTLDAREFAAFDNGLTDVPSLQEQADLLKKLGYSGVAWRPEQTAEMLEALDRHQLKMFSSYVVVKTTRDSFEISPELIAEIKALRGRETYVWLTLSGDGSDETAVKAIREMADIAQANGLPLSLYPHFKYVTSTVSRCLELARLADHPNVSITFNLCHFLKQNSEADIEKTLRAAAPLLSLVSINGADSGATQTMGWDRLIQPLGQGSYDVSKMLTLLDEIDYQGPVLLQCYNIKQPAAQHLKQSIETWRRLSSAANAHP